MNEDVRGERWKLTIPCVFRLHPITLMALLGRSYCKNSLPTRVMSSNLVPCACMYGQHSFVRVALSSISID